jgi:hypothetical protein
VLIFCHDRNRPDQGDLTAACRFKPETGWSPTYGGADNVTSSCHADHYGNVDLSAYGSSPVPQRILVECRYSGGSNVGTLTAAESTLYSSGASACCAGWRADQPGVVCCKCGCAPRSLYSTDGKFINHSQQHQLCHVHRHFSTSGSIYGHTGNDSLTDIILPPPPPPSSDVFLSTFAKPDVVMAPPDGQYDSGSSTLHRLEPIDELPTSVCGSPH